MNLMRRALEARTQTPETLYHSSGFKANDLRPGIAYTGKKVEWDHGESNEWLYATTDRSAAIDLGIASALEKKFRLDRYQTDAYEIVITSPDRIHLDDLKELKVYLYTIDFSGADGWVKNDNAHNHLDTEWKTKKTVSYSEVEQVDVEEWMRGKKINIIKS